MLHQHWLLFLVVWLIGMVADANKSVYITVKLSSVSDLVKCQSCLTDIAGLNRLSLAHIESIMSDSNTPSTLAVFKASGLVSSFLRAGIDCQHIGQCDSITVPHFDIASTVPSSPRFPINADMIPLVTYCLLTDSPKSVECGMCLKMASGSESIQKFRLVNMDGSVRYLHVLITWQQDILQPCLLSDICSGPTYEFVDASCKHLVKKISLPPLFGESKNTPSTPNYYAHQDVFKSTIDSIRESIAWEPECFRTTASHSSRTSCLDCMARQSRGIAVLLAYNTMEFNSEGHAGDSEQYILVLSQNPQVLPEICRLMCTTVESVVKETCTQLSTSNVDYSYPQGKIYYNMRIQSYRRPEIVQTILKKHETSKCMRVEHEPKNQKLCQDCLELKAKLDVRRLSQIELLISSNNEFKTSTVSDCITFGSHLTKNLCKVATDVPDQFCIHSDPSLPGRNGNILRIPPTKNKLLVSTSRRWPEKPTLDCYTCLTSRMDILLIDFFYPTSFWMVGGPQENYCFMECGVLNMAKEEALDISSLRPISSESLELRYRLAGQGAEMNIWTNQERDHSSPIYGGSTSQVQHVEQGRQREGAKKNTNSNRKNKGKRSSSSARKDGYDGRNEEQDNERFGAEQKTRAYFSLYENMLADANMGNPADTYRGNW